MKKDKVACSSSSSMSPANSPGAKRGGKNSKLADPASTTLNEMASPFANRKSPRKTARSATTQEERDANPPKKALKFTTTSPDSSTSEEHDHEEGKMKLKKEELPMADKEEAADTRFEDVSPKIAKKGKKNLTKTLSSKSKSFDEDEYPQLDSTQPVVSVPLDSSDSLLNRTKSCTPEKKDSLLPHSPSKDQSQISEGTHADDCRDDDDDDLILRSLEPKEVFEKGDLVFAKYQKYPDWPAVIASVEMKGKSVLKYKVQFIDSSPKSNVFSLAPSHVRPFTETCIDQIKRASAGDELLMEAIEIAEIKLRARAGLSLHLVNPDLVAKYQRHVSSVSGKEPEKEEEVVLEGNEREGNANIGDDSCDSSEPSSSSSEEDSDAEERAKLHSRYDLYTKHFSKKDIGKELQKFKKEISKIMEGKTRSSFLKDFKAGNRKELSKKVREHACWPLFNESQQEALSLLREWYPSEPDELITHVLLPEMSVLMIRRVERVSKEEAKRLLFVPAVGLTTVSDGRKLLDSFMRDRVAP